MYQNYKFGLQIFTIDIFIYLLAVVIHFFHKHFFVLIKGLEKI